MRQAAARQPLPGERAQAHAWWLQRALWFGGVNVLVGSCGMELVVHLVPGSYSLIFLWKPWLLTRVRATVLVLPEASRHGGLPGGQCSSQGWSPFHGGSLHCVWLHPRRYADGHLKETELIQSHTVQSRVMGRRVCLQCPGVSGSHQGGVTLLKNSSSSCSH